MFTIVPIMGPLCFSLSGFVSNENELPLNHKDQCAGRTISAMELVLVGSRFFYVIYFLLHTIFLYFLWKILSMYWCNFTPHTNPTALVRTKSQFLIFFLKWFCSLGELTFCFWNMVRATSTEISGKTFPLKYYVVLVINVVLYMTIKTLKWEWPASRNHGQSFEITKYGLVLLEMNHPKSYLGILFSPFSTQRHQMPQSSMPIIENNSLVFSSCHLDLAISKQALLVSVTSISCFYSSSRQVVYCQTRGQHHLSSWNNVEFWHGTKHSRSEILRLFCLKSK